MKPLYPSSPKTASVMAIKSGVRELEAVAVVRERSFRKAFQGHSSIRRVDVTSGNATGAERALGSSVYVPVNFTGLMEQHEISGGSAGAHFE